MNHLSRRQFGDAVADSYRANPCETRAAMVDAAAGSKVVAQIAGSLLNESRERIEKLETALARVLADIDFMVESRVIPDARDDVIYVSARSVLGKETPNG